MERDAVAALHVEARDKDAALRSALDEIRRLREVRERLSVERDDAVASKLLTQKELDAAVAAAASSAMEAEAQRKLRLSQRQAEVSRAQAAMRTAVAAEKATRRALAAAERDADSSMMTTNGGTKARARGRAYEFLLLS